MGQGFIFLLWLHTMRLTKLPYACFQLIFLGVIFEPRFVAHAAYNVSERVMNRYTYMRPFSQIGAATIVRDNALYTMGGLSQYVNTTKPTSNFVGFQLNQLNGNIETEAIDQYNTPKLAYGQAVLLPDNDRVLLFGGKNEDKWDENSTLLVHEYRFSTSMWQQLNVTAANNATNNGTVPRNTHRHTATLAPNGKIYIYGGLVPGTITRWFIYVWEYDPATGRFTEFPMDYRPVSTVSLTGVALP